MSESVARRTYLQLFGFLALTAVVLWPEPSYYALLRYGTVPTILTALPYLLPGATLVAALYLGLSEPVSESDFTALSARLLVYSTTIVSLALPYTVLALLAANVDLLRIAVLITVLFPTVLFYNALGLFFSRAIPYPTVRHMAAWTTGALLLPATALYLPAVNPVVAAANATGSARLLSGGPWTVVIAPYPFLVAAGIPLLGAGILTALVILWKR